MRILVLNCGSSSVKLRLADSDTGEWFVRGSVERIGAPDSRGRIDRPGELPRTESIPAPDFGTAIRWLEGVLAPDERPEAVGHRVVHGGERYVRPVPVDDRVLAELEAISYLAPLHNPQSLEGIRTARDLFPGLPQVAVFDTAFHATLPEHAYRYAVPERYYREHGIRRYGFHGLNHRHVSERAAARLGRGDLRLVSLHLGNGCSACAVRSGCSVDTSMGLTPLAGLVMGTRAGDVDPSVPLRLLELGYTAAEVDTLLNHESGLKALSGGLTDMRDIEAAAAGGDHAAILAFTLFCYRARQYVGAYAAALGGLDALVFTAGIGEHSASVRAEVCRGLEHLGVRVDPELNRSAAGTECDLAPRGAPARVLVVPADEERIIARDTAAVVHTIRG